MGAAGDLTEVVLEKRIHLPQGCVWFFFFFFSDKGNFSFKRLFCAIRHNSMCLGHLPTPPPPLDHQPASGDDLGPWTVCHTRSG